MNNTTMSMNFRQDVKADIAWTLRAAVSLVVLRILDGVASDVFSHTQNFSGISIGVWIRIIATPIAALILIAARGPASRALAYFASKLAGSSLTSKYMPGASPLNNLSGRIVTVVILIILFNFIEPALRVFSDIYPRLHLSEISGFAFTVVIGTFLYTIIKDARPLSEDIAGLLRTLIDKIPAELRKQPGRTAAAPPEKKDITYCWNCGARTDQAETSSKAAAAKCPCGADIPPNCTYCPACGKSR